MVPRTLTPPPGVPVYKSDSNGNSIAAIVTNGDNNGIEEEENDIMETNGNNDDNLVDDNNSSNDGDNGGENVEQKEQFKNGEVGTIKVGSKEENEVLGFSYFHSSFSPFSSLAGHSLTLT